MSFISEKVAYLDGLSDGLEIDKDPNGKLIKGMIDVLGAIAEELEEQSETIDDLSECIDEISDELDDIEDCLDDEDEDEDEEDAFDEDDFVEVTCPHCGETIYFDEDMLDSEDGLICPSCNEAIELNIPDCGCGCGCDCDKE